MDTTITITDTATERPIRTYFALVNRLFREPARFFREMPFSLNGALTFGIVSAWLAAAVSFVLETVHSYFFARLFENWVQRFLSSEAGFSLFGLTGSSFLWSAGVLLLGPFLFLFQIFFGSVVLYLFARLLIEESEIAPEHVTFGAVLRIEAVAFSSYWLSIVPVFGGMIAFVANLVLLVTGVKERFRVSTRRAAVVVLAPYFFLALFLLLLGLLVMLLLFQLPFGDYLDVSPHHWFLDF